MSATLYRPTFEALIARLRADTPLTTLVGQRIYGRRAPQNATFPYVVVNASAQIWDTKNRRGYDLAVRLQGYARGGAGVTATEQGDAILTALYNSLHQTRFAVTGGSMLDCSQNGLAEVALEPDNKTAQAVLEMRVIVQV